ncbi:hypothetical protein D3C80_736030 [compost metagenome]
MHFNLNIAARQIAQDQRRIFPKDLHIRIEIVFEILFQRRLDVFRAAAVRIGGEFGQHTPDLAARDFGVAVTGDQRRGDKLMMQPLINILFRFARRAFLFADTGGGKRVAVDAVDFIKREPVAHQIFIAVEADIAEAHERVHHVAVHPAVISLTQRQRHFVVRKRHQRLDVMATQFAEHLFVKLQARFIWRRVFAIRENTRPGDGHAQHFKAHLGKQRDIVFIVVIEIDAATLRVKGVVFAFKRILNIFIRQRHVAVIIFQRQIGFPGDGIRHRRSFAINVPGPFGLISGNCAAP